MASILGSHLQQPAPACRAQPFRATASLTVFSLTVLRTVRSSTDAIGEFVPQISVTAAYVLTIASVVGLVLFLAHLAGEIRVETMLITVQRDAVASVRHTLSELETTGDNSFESQQGAVPLTVPQSGFLTGVRSAQLCRVAAERELVIIVTADTGSSVVQDTPAGLAWPRHCGRTLTDDEWDSVRASFGDALAIGFERTSVDDIGFGLRQLTDIAAKALSPGVNDPTTATHALRHSSAVLCALARLPLGDELVRDDLGTLRVVVRRPTFADLLRLAVDQPRRYGADEPQVAERMFQLLAEVAWIARRPEQHAALQEELERLWSGVTVEELEPVQRERYQRLRARVEDTLSS